MEMQELSVQMTHLVADVSGVFREMGVSDWTRTRGAGACTLMGPTTKVAKNIYYSNRELAHMVLSLKPFGCMPSTQSDGAQSAVVAHYKDMIYLPIETSGEGEINAHSRVQMALGEAKNKAKKEFAEALAKTGLTLEQCKAEQAAKSAASKFAPFVLVFFAEIVMAWALYGVLTHMGMFAFRAGMIAGALCWLGFVLTTVAVNNAFSGRRPMLTLIDAGHWLGVLVIIGAILGWMGR